MEVKINREIRQYTESMFFGLSMRQFFFSLAAAAVALILYFVLKPHLGTETVSWVCILGAVPFAAMCPLTERNSFSLKPSRESPTAKGPLKKSYSSIRTKLVSSMFQTLRL